LPYFRNSSSADTSDILGSIASTDSAVAFIYRP
jgi:hypothetical protein